MCDVLVELVGSLYSHRKLVSFKPELLCEENPFKVLETRLGLTPVDMDNAGNTEWRVYRVDRAMLFLVVFREGDGRYRVKHVVFTPHKVSIHVHSNRSTRKSDESTQHVEASGSV